MTIYKYFNSSGQLEECQSGWEGIVFESMMKVSNALK